MLDWLRYSGASISFMINPCHWHWIPRRIPEPKDAWPRPHQRSLVVSWLGITLRAWIDDGAW